MIDDIIYAGQDYRLVLDTGIDITGMSTVEIHYRKPGSRVELTKSGYVVDITKISVDFGATENDTAGDLRAHAYVVSPSGIRLLGQLATVSIHSKWGI